MKLIMAVSGFCKEPSGQSAPRFLLAVDQRVVLARTGMAVRWLMHMQRLLSAKCCGSAWLIKWLLCWTTLPSQHEQFWKN
jgi:hypothetical protein